MNSSLIFLLSLLACMAPANAFIPYAFFQKAFVPNAFSFTNQTGVAVSSPITSNAVTLSGSGSMPVTATCSNCTLQRNGTGSFLSSISGFKSGDTITLRVTSSASNSTPVTASVQVGRTTSSTWSVTTASACAPGSQIFAYSGSTQNFNVPSGCTTITVKAWGAGGGGGGGTGGVDGGTGGGGAYVSSVLSVTPGEALTIKVGGAGANGWSPKGPAGGYDTGGSGHNGDNGGAAGGGATFLFRSSTALLIAAGGGGGGGSCTSCGTWNPGGNGGSAGQNGNTGGASCEPGTAGNQSGYAGLAGRGYGGGGGGGGLNGGGSGNGFNGGCGGGGGSSLGTTVQISNARTAPNTGDGDYPGSSVGEGGIANGNGGNGYMIIRY